MSDGRVIDNSKVVVAVVEKKQVVADSSKSKSKRKAIKAWRSFLIKFGLIGVVLFCVFYFVLGVHIYHGENMYPFIMDGDLLITYKLDSYNVGDVVVYKDPDLGETRVSRIGMYGENEIDIDDYGQIFVNGYLPAESVFYKTEKLPDSKIEFPYQMHRDDYFLLDDYRIEGYDSRQFGAVSSSRFMGKVVYVFRKRGI